MCVFVSMSYPNKYIGYDFTDWLLVHDNTLNSTVTRLIAMHKLNQSLVSNKCEYLSNTFYTTYIATCDNKIFFDKVRSIITAYKTTQVNMEACIRTNYK